MRAPTPSAAAEIVLRSRQEFERHIADYQRQLVHHARYLLSERRHRVRDLQTHRGFRQMELLLRRRHQQIDELSSSLAVGLRMRLAASPAAADEGGRASLSSFDLRRRASLLRRRIDQQRTRCARRWSAWWRKKRAASARPRCGLRLWICARGWGSFAAPAKSTRLNCACAWIVCWLRGGARLNPRPLQLRGAQPVPTARARLRHRLRRQRASAALRRTGRYRRRNRRPPRSRAGRRHRSQQEKPRVAKFENARPAE